MTTHFLWLAPALALSLPLLVRAQDEPTDPKSSAQPLRYASAFSDYKPWQETKRGDWRQLNDNVRPATKDGQGHRHGGPGATPSAPSPSASSLASPTHRGHHVHGGKP